MTEHDNLYDLLHALSIITLLGAFIGWLPSIATALAVVWYLVRLYESPTIKSMGRWVRRKVTGKTGTHPSLD